jgi:hypothetical protein
MKRAGPFTWLFLGLGLLLSACSGQPGFLPPKDDPKSLPFNDSSHSDGISPTLAFTSSSIPAGTVVAIRLRSALSSAGLHSGDPFQAVLDGPLVIQGQTLAPSGTAITGRVLAARASEPHAPGYLRLTLSTVILNGKAVDVHTSSVFCKGGLREYLNSGSGAANDVQFSTGRRLTFRLIQPLPLQG